jgi:hypothetical protein
LRAWLTFLASRSWLPRQPSVYSKQMKIDTSCHAQPMLQYGGLWLRMDTISIRRNFFWLVPFDRRLIGKMMRIKYPDLSNIWLTDAIYFLSFTDAMFNCNLFDHISSADFNLMCRLCQMSRAVGASMIKNSMFGRPVLEEGRCSIRQTRVLEF